MRNEDLNSKKLIKLISSLPYFKMTDLLAFKESHYARVLVFRYAKKGKILRLKKGLYVSKDYIDSVKIRGNHSNYIEFIANILNTPSYLSLEYVLFEYGMITELPKNFTSVSLVKTIDFSNDFGKFFYHKIKDSLFLGFNSFKKDGLIISKATKAKALFDFLYFRKNILSNEDPIAELRINMESMLKSDWKEFEGYVNLEGSKKMKNVFNILKKWSY